jgi:hypothetical protein
MLAPKAPCWIVSQREPIDRKHKDTAIRSRSQLKQVEGNGQEGAPAMVQLSPQPGKKLNNKSSPTKRIRSC